MTYVRTSELNNVYRTDVLLCFYQIPETRSATFNCEILHRITKESKKKGRNRVLLLHYLVPAICALQEATPMASPTPTKLNTNNHPPLLLCENSFRLRGKHGSP